MKLEEYVKHLSKLIEEGHGDKEVIYSKDDEGNGYYSVNYAPCLCYYDSENDYTYFDDFCEEYKRNINAICVN